MPVSDFLSFGFISLFFGGMAGIVFYLYYAGIAPENRVYASWVVGTVAALALFIVGFAMNPFL